MLRQIYRYPKLILNTSKATSTDTIHRVRFKDGFDKEQLVASFHNSLTFAFSEVLGRSYGGGVLELEPREAEKLPVPFFPAKKLSIKEIDSHLLRGDVNAVLELTDKELLIKQLGLTPNEVQMLRTIWAKLQARRSGRKMMSAIAPPVTAPVNGKPTESRVPVAP